ncbi:acetolactate synthase small subunit [bacterium]|nr:acetolactate synthase small subunit [bacterium]
MRHTLSVLVENKPGVLARVAGLFKRRGFNIESLAVSITQDPSTSRMTIVVDGEEQMIEQIEKQLNKLIDVIKVIDYTFSPTLERELALVKVEATPQTRREILDLTHIFRATVVDVAENSLIIEITGDVEKIDAFISLVTPYGIKEIVRTGKIVMARGLQSL